MKKERQIKVYMFEIWDINAETDSNQDKNGVTDWLGERSAVAVAQAKTHWQKLFLKKFLSISLEFFYLFEM